jgi:hypothetical protein
MRTTVAIIVISFLSSVALAGDVDLSDPAIPERLELKQPDWIQVRALLEKRAAEGYMILALYWNSSERWVEAKATARSDRKSGAYFFYRKFEHHWYEVDEAVSWRE